jgi:hypothetical protein
MKWVVILALSVGVPMPEINGAKVYPRYYAEFSSHQACLEWLLSILELDQVPIIYAAPEPCSLAAESVPQGIPDNFFQQRQQPRKEP